MRKAAIIAIAGIAICGAAWAQSPLGLVPEEHYEVLVACVTDARAANTDVATCKGGVTALCVEAVQSAGGSRVEAVLCLQREEFAWSALSMQLGSDYLDRQAENAAFSRETYLRELEARLGQSEACFDFPIGQEAKVLDCNLDHAISLVQWSYDLLDGNAE